MTSELPRVFSRVQLKFYISIDTEEHKFWWVVEYNNVLERLGKLVPMTVELKCTRKR